MKGTLTLNTAFQKPVVKYTGRIMTTMEFPEYIDRECFAEISNIKRITLDGIILVRGEKEIPYGSEVNFTLLDGKAKVL